MAGIMRILDAIWAFMYNGPVVDDLHDAIFGRSLTAYGWIWLIVGVVLIASGVHSAAGDGLGHGSALDRHHRRRGRSHHPVAWLPFYPIWSLVYIGLGLAVIYALVAHFGEVEAAGLRSRGPSSELDFLDACA